MVSDKVGDLYVNYSDNHIGSDPVVSNAGLPSNGQNDYSQQWAEYYRCVQFSLLALTRAQEVVCNIYEIFPV